MNTKEMRKVLRALNKRLGNVGFSEQERGQVIRAGLKGWRYPVARVLSLLRAPTG